MQKELKLWINEMTTRSAAPYPGDEVLYTYV